MHENVLAVVGNVVNDPVVRVTRAGVPFAAFRIASTARRYNPATREFEDGQTNFYNVTAFRALAANVHRSVTKGQPVVVTGRLRVNQFTRADGTSGTSVEIDAHAVGHDLTRGSAVFTKSTGIVQLDETDRLSDPVIQAAHGAAGGEEGEGYDEEFDVVDPVTGEVADRGSRPGGSSAAGSHPDAGDDGEPATEAVTTELAAV